MPLCHTARKCEMSWNRAKAIGETVGEPSIGDGAATARRRPLHQIARLQDRRERVELPLDRGETQIDRRECGGHVGIGELAVFAFEGETRGRLPKDHIDLTQGKGLGQVILRPETHRIDRRFERTVARDHHHIRRGVGDARGRKDGETVGARWNPARRDPVIRSVNPPAVAPGVQIARSLDEALDAIDGFR